MKKKDLLKSYYEMTCHNLLTYSKNYLMSEAKEGYQEEWNAAREECDLLKEMIDQLPDLYLTKQEFTFIGTVSSYLIGFSKANNEHYIQHLIIGDREGNERMFQVEYFAGKKILDEYDTERHVRYDKNIDTNIVFTVSNFSQRIERWEWLVEND